VEYSDVFVKAGTQNGQNQIVKHIIDTTGAPIQQPVHRLLMALKYTIDEEVTKCPKRK